MKSAEDWLLNPLLGGKRDETLAGVLTGRLVYHVTPLHYLLSIIDDGALFCKDVLAERGIAPRSSAVRRDHALRLGSYVHLSLESETPLLRDKLAKGYPHAVLVFDGGSLANQEGVALLPSNTKAWRSRASFAPSMDVRLICNWLDRTHGNRPSVELIIKYAVSLSDLVSIDFTTEEERVMLERWIASVGLKNPAPFAVRGSGGVRYNPTTLQTIRAYVDLCSIAKTVIAPPRIVFD